MGNKKGHTESMDAMAKDNLEKTDERKAQYDAESDAQRHCNADGKAMNAMKIRDLRAANEKKSAAMRVDNEAEIVEMRRLGAKGDAEHSAWMDGLCAKNIDDELPPPPPMDGDMPPPQPRDGAARP